MDAYLKNLFFRYRCAIDGKHETLIQQVKSEFRGALVAAEMFGKDDLFYRALLDALKGLPNESPHDWFMASHCLKLIAGE